MAVYESHHVAEPAFGSRLAGLIASIYSWLVQRRDRAATRKALQSLSDHELYDIGLERGDIENIC